ncbi:hypothetical protein RJ640_005933 [Escallonia rubra]|uniref:Uncharacterized protein n=1 Tax=Escallonia rubra TaxID=112253 RepID=A0AA88RL05_9ASTE|nr:hypothetical protein RJ640_005933 [Escallonia rubra]
MEKVQSSAPPPPSTSDARQEMPAVSRIKKDLLSFGASLQEGFRYLKASLVGQVKKMRARSEKEASEADLQASKMQVEAADAAEDTKKHLDEPK